MSLKIGRAVLNTLIRNSASAEVICGDFCDHLTAETGRQKETNGIRSLLVRVETGWSFSLKRAAEGQAELTEELFLEKPTSGQWLGILCQRSVRHMLRNTENLGLGFLKERRETLVNC